MGGKLSGWVSAEVIRLELLQEAVDLRLAGNVVLGRAKDVVVAKTGDGRRIFWICRSTFESPEAWTQARAFVDGAA